MIPWTKEKQEIFDSEKQTFGKESALDIMTDLEFEELVERVCIPKDEPECWEDDEFTKLENETRQRLALSTEY